MQKAKGSRIRIKNDKQERTNRIIHGVWLPVLRITDESSPCIIVFFARV